MISFVGSMRGASLPRRSWYGIAGAALLIASGAIHLDLYVTGYNSIPTIGPLFLLQIIAAFLLAAAIPLTGLRLAYAAGAGFGLATLGGYLLTLKVGLFGFTEVRTTAGIIAALIDVAIFAVLAAGMISGLGLGRRLLPAVGAVSAIALALTIAFVASPTTPAPVATGGGGGGQTLDARTVGRQGPAHQRQGPHPLHVRPGQGEQVRLLRGLRHLLAAGAREHVGRPGVTGKIGTITRTDGTTQATYDGHPLYTYIGDHGPGTASGNNINLNGGLWLDVPVGSG